MSDLTQFMFVISLAAVINGLGLAKWLATLGEFLGSQKGIEVKHSLPYTLFAAYQFFVHILMWWLYWGVSQVESINFLHYLYLLLGPVLLFLGTSILVPKPESEVIALESHYLSTRKSYWMVTSLYLLWGVLLWPVLTQAYSPTIPVLMMLLAVSLTALSTTNLKIHQALGFLCWLILIGYVVMFAMEIGTVPTHIYN